MARVLILDDDKNRHKTFKRNLIGHEHVTHAHTYDEAVEALQKRRFDVVYLDHDLNDHEFRSVDYSGGYGGPREMTGVDVALFIKSLPEEMHPQITVVHSMNHSGAVNIMSVMKQVRTQTVREVFHQKIGLNLRG